MHAPVSLALLLVTIWSGPAAAQDRGDRSLGAEMSRDRAEGRIERLKIDRAEKEKQDKARAEAIQKERTKDRTKP